LTFSEDRKGDVTTMDARNSEPDLGYLLDLVEDEPDLASAGDDRQEPRLFAPEKPAAKRGEDNSTSSGLAFSPTDRFGPSPSVAPARTSRREPQDSDLVARAITLWGGFWRAVVIGLVSGTVGGIVGAFTLVWLTGAGWTTFAKLLIDAIGRL